ncbi:MAG: DUF4376 domain-containing protein [Cutibacterium sp.]|nr:DUF4376 domain-containing protein [Cutibacterium sp.]
MKTYARIEDATVVEVLSTDGNIKEMFHPSMKWVDFSSVTGCEVGWQYECDVLSPPDGPSIAEARNKQIAIIEAAYRESIQQPVSYMSTTFQADLDSQDILAKSLVAGALPDGFFWLDKDNAQVPMTFAQLQGLAGAIIAQGQAAFYKKTTLKTQIRAANSVSEVQAIIWV